MYYRAGVNLERQRVASPFLCEAQESLALYKVIDPNTWGKMIGRVNGVNFTVCMVVPTPWAGRAYAFPKDIPGGVYAISAFHFAHRTRRNYLRKLTGQHTILAEKGGCLSDEYHIEGCNDAKAFPLK